MKRPQDGAVLDWWERARTLPPLERALHLLALFVDAGAEAIADWPIGRRDRALLAARAMLIGPEICATAACPACGTEVEAAFDAAAIAVDDPAENEAALESGIRLRAATSRDLALALASPEPRLALAQACVVAGAPRKRGWSEALLAEAAAALQALDPQADIRLRLTCTECAAPWSAPLFVEPFLWREMAGWARARFDEVDRLARAYGWREADVLALSPQRRRTYLALAAA
ncbi:hypothetical protein OF829_04590 [Sphingomonas sp. LB-2]|uniref:hypothetical protein n=1 Tax=Sphingomonas caeni TaxID=2984949 RepID=UPI00222F75D0|nr:hypothetical protein [Sphingomonas caeni]MCW3846505.1 hypothetical protein [Sphingomonas caeni]